MIIQAEVCQSGLFTNYATHVQGQGRDKQEQAGSKWRQAETMKQPTGESRDMQDQEEAN